MKIDKDGWATMGQPCDDLPAAMQNARNALVGSPPVLSRNEIQREAQGLEWTLRILIKQHGVQAFMRSLGNALADR